jgi:hypothetical protein
MENPSDPAIVSTLLADLFRAIPDDGSSDTHKTICLAIQLGYMLGARSASEDVRKIIQSILEPENRRPYLM